MSPTNIIRACRRLRGNQFAEQAIRAARRSMSTLDPDESREHLDRAHHFYECAINSRSGGRH